jgi:hypothetical protein
MRNEQSMLRTDEVLSETDIILPSQYFGLVGSVGMSGEQRLMLAVLVDAINVLQTWKGTGSAHKRRNFAEAAQWVNTRGTGYPFSFDSVCDALEIDSELLRSRLRLWTLRPANSARRPSLARLRLKELSRAQRVTANRSRRREHADRTMPAMSGNASDLTSHWQDAERAKDCTAEVSTGLAACNEGSVAKAAPQNLSW